MTALMIALASIAAWGTMGTLELVARDGYGRIPTRDAYYTGA